VFPALLLVFTACSFALDSNEAQCSVDDDCLRFDDGPDFTGRAVCQAGVCVNSHLGPKGCSFAEPKSADDFANHCTAAKTLQFDNCTRLGLCDDSALTGAMSAKVAPMTQGALPAPIGQQQTPTERCTDVLTNIIYVTGSTNLPPLIKAVQPLLDMGSPAYTVVFAPQTSCKGAAAIYDPDPSKHLIFNTTNNFAFYYKNGEQKFCLLDAGGNTVDVGESDVYPQSCNYPQTQGIADYPGPIQAITFVVPPGSKQTAISAEAAHLVFGAGGNQNQAAPWTDPNLYFIRSSGTGTVQLPSRAIGIEPASWWGIDRLSAQNLVESMKLVNPLKADQAIGILSSDFADKNRANLKVLAFQQHGQRTAYFPDSSFEATDKSNVRDGHYPIWGAIHFLTPTVGDVPPEKARALIQQLAVPKLEKSVVEAIIEAGYVPPCAMAVTHNAEVGPLSTFEPELSCGCYFDMLATGATTCKSCNNSSECNGPTQACNYGYCDRVKPPTN
jgi:hypothetical protein